MNACRAGCFWITGHSHRIQYFFWEEVKKGLAMKDFTIENAMDRTKSEGDIFKPVLGKGIGLNSVLKKM